MLINSKGRRKGLTLIESLVVVGILLGIVAVALTLYGTVKNRLDVKNESENISIIYSQIKDLYSDEGTKDLTNTVAVQLGVIPKKMNVNSDGKTVYNTWGGKVDVKGNGDNGFILTYPKVPSGSVCVDLIRNQRKVGWDKYGVGSSANTQFSGLSNKDLTVSCASTKDYVDVVFQSGEDSGL